MELQVGEYVPETYGLLLALLLPALLVCLLLPTLLVRKWSSSKGLQLPPGPRPLPLIGHLHLLGLNPHHSLCDLSKTYGPLMYLRFGSLPVVVASSPSMARYILQTHDQTFAWRAQLSVAMHLNACTDVLFSQPGPYWKLVRQLCVTDLLGNKRLQSFRPLIAEEVHALLCSIIDTAAEVPLRSKLYAATSHIISRMALGKRLTDLAIDSQADPSYNLVNLLIEAIHLLGVFNVGDFIPILAWMDLQGCIRKTKAVAQKLHIGWQEIIDKRRELRHKSIHPASQEVNFLDVLLSASERADVQITDFNIMAILMDMFAGGTDTSSITVEWALGELLTNPVKMKKVQEELDRVVGTSRLVQESDIPHLHYLGAVVKETMRLHPVIPLLVPHKASQQCHISGYDIPINTLAYINVWAIGRDPTIWDRPLEFYPERFLNCAMDVRGQHFELLPFGSGRRACRGISLGLISVHLMLASLLHAFDWTTDDKPNLSEKFGMVMTLADPLIAKATPRLPQDFFVKGVCDSKGLES